MLARILIVALGLGAAAAHAQDAALERFFDAFTDEWVSADPNLATSTRYFSGERQQALERQLTPETRAWREDRSARARRGTAELAGFDRERMSAAQRLSADVMRWQLERVVEGERYADYQFPLEQNGGAQVRLVNALVVVHPLNGEADGRNYVARLAQLPLRLAEALGEARRLAARRMIPPAFILRTTVAQMREFVAVPAAGNPLVTVLDERLAPAGVATPVREALKAEAERIVREAVYPLWEEATDFLAALEPGAGNDAGLWRFPGGDAAYAYQLRRYTSTTLSAEEIHAVGLREVARIETQMEAILRQLGRTSGSLRERLEALEQELRYSRDEHGRREILADLERMVADAERRAVPLFERRPAAPVVVRPYPRFREATAAASYTAPSPDGSRPGMFQMPLRPSRMTRLGLRTLVYHETVPGHHFQISLEMEALDQPRFRRLRALGGISAFAEGWALYAERLAAEAGWYEGDLPGRLGQLAAELFRARRLVADTGLHAMRWTREQAIAYGFEPSEVERYVMNPGQACAYRLGELKILELREKARRALGERFRLPGFHEAVLSTGTVPLALLEERIDAHISGNRK